MRPLNTFAMGMIGSWAGLAARLPGLTNFFTQAPGLSSLAKAMGGIAQERRLPRFAARPFRQVFSARERKNVAGVSVLLWPDTFNNYYHPETALAATEVLEHAGYRVELPTAGLCCGRPLYDSGMLDRAKRQLRQILEVLRPQIDAGMPVVVLEPACLAVFRDEMPNLFPLDETAGKLARQSFMLSEFLVKARYTPPRLAASALVHGHCHQKAVTGMGDEIRMLEKLGLDFDVLDSGCCGMSGSFGFDKHKYRVSVDIGELVLLPEVRAASHDTLIVTNGYSCREQIEQCAGRKALHLAEVLQMSIQRHGSARPGLHHSERTPPPVEVS
jgi:Fe-S oxidoreductase